MRDLERGYIDKDKILSYVTEEDIFKLVFEEISPEFEYVTSPLREDNNPGCWFQKGVKGDLRFVDFANTSVIDGIDMRNIDCFNAVQVYYGLGNFYRTLEYIRERLILGKNLRLLPKEKRSSSKLMKKLEFSVDIEVRDFEPRDARFWKPFGISKQNLIDDKVFAVLRYSMKNTKNGDFLSRPETNCYAFTDFKSGRKKLYFPFLKGKYRFITDCTIDDVGGIDSLSTSGDTLFITKSYKDWRVLKNLGCEAIWFQSEIMFPSNNVLISLCNRYKRVIIFFDNDKTGVSMSQRLKELINTFLPDKSDYIHLPIELEKRGITDPSDMQSSMGVTHLYKFLKENV